MSRKAPVKYPQEARERVVDLAQLDNSYEKIRQQLQEEFPDDFKTKTSPSDGWIRKCLAESEIVEEEKILSTDGQPPLNKILGEYIRKAVANRIAQSFEISHQQPNDLAKIMDIENIAIKKQQAIIFRLYGQDTMEALYGKGSVNRTVKPITPAVPTLDSEFDGLIRRDLQVTKMELLKKQMEKMKGGDGGGDNTMGQLSQILMLDKMTREEKTNTTKDIITIAEALKPNKNESNAGIAVLLETIKMNREQTNLQEQLRIKERDLQYQRELEMRSALDKERADALRREITLLQERQSQATQTPEQLMDRMTYWEEKIKVFRPNKSTGDFHKDIEIRKINLQEKGMDTAVKLVDSRLLTIENTIDKAFNTWLNMVERQQERNLESQGFSASHPRDGSQTRQTPLAPPPRSEEQRNQAYKEISASSAKLEELRKIRTELTRKAGGL